MRSIWFATAAMMAGSWFVTVPGCSTQDGKRNRQIDPPEQVRVTDGWWVDALEIPRTLRRGQPARTCKQS